MLVPLRYNLRSLFVRRTTTALTVLGIGATVAVVAGLLSLQNGFSSLFKDAGREDIGIFLRPGASSEGESMFRRDKADRLVKTLSEIRADADGRPLASMECYLAVRRFRVDGGETNVPMRGVEPRSFDVYGKGVRIIDGAKFKPGADEVIVGRKLVGRIENCEIGDIIQINVAPMRVVGVFESDGPFESEIWGDLDRMLEALQRPSPNRIVALLRDGTDIEGLTKRLEDDKEVPAKFLTERAYLTGQTKFLSGALMFLAGFLGTIMGLAAVFTATNTMLSSIAARTHEIGILGAAGFRPVPIFLSFLFEALVLGLFGGAVGCLIALPLNGLQTSGMNFNTFTEVAFAFRVDAGVLTTAVLFAVILGLIGGTIPAWRAARLAPVEALRRK